VTLLLASVLACVHDVEREASPGASNAALQRGRALLGRNCVGCHGDDLSGSPVAGWSPNLTPDAKTGLGEWTRAEVIAALRTGIRRDGRTLCSTMPRFAENELSNEELNDIVLTLTSASLEPKDSPRRDACKRP
jgi:mono/diheme cytochrome c family protein